jgi:hypothetical protein
MTVDIAREVLEGELCLEDGYQIWLDVWDHRLRRIVCRIKGHVPYSCGDNRTTPYEKWCDRCSANLLVLEEF